MPKEPTFYTINEAAEILRLKDRRTVIKWGQEGRIRIVGKKRQLLVVIASIDEYARGESAWHQKQEQARPNVPPSSPRRAGRSRRPVTNDTITLPGQKLKRP